MVDQSTTAPLPPHDLSDFAEPSLLAVELLAACGASQLAERVTVRWNARLRSTAGRAYPRKWLVELNPHIRAYPGETSRTLRHELAHLLVAWNVEAPGGTSRRRVRGRRLAIHGPEWKRACALLGIDGEERCHQLALAAPRRLARPYAYECPACRVVLRRVRPIKRGRMLACGECCRRQARGRFDVRFRLHPVEA